MGAAGGVGGSAAEETDIEVDRAVAAAEAAAAAAGDAVTALGSAGPVAPSGRLMVSSTAAAARDAGAVQSSIASMPELPSPSWPVIVHTSLCVCIYIHTPSQDWSDTVG